jgi:alkyl sulfatase BDS1-like metallo-beta-lactamase superfamily hydrolase
MTDLRELAERAWRGELDMAHEHHPVHTSYEGASQLAPDLLALKGIAGIYVLDTGDGLVMLDAGSLLDVEHVHAAVREWRPDVPLAAVVFSHHHVDHVFAVARFEEEHRRRGWPPPVVYAHELLPAHFDRYRRTLGWNTAINRRQFAIDAPKFRWPDRYRYPDVVYRDRLTFERGALSFHLRHGRGETDDHTWTWVPERRILATGDLFIWAVPNAGNPQKVERYVADWADALDAMNELGAETLLPGHGLPIFGAERIHEALETTASFLRSIETQALDLMNRGCSLDEVLHAVALPSGLMQRPFLRPVYDDPRFLVRMVWRRYGGWWDGEYDTLLPAPKAAQAAEWIALAGGLGNVLARASLLLAEGKHALARHLVETAYHAAPEDDGLHALRAAVYAASADAEASSMARNILRHAARASVQKRRDTAGSA